MTMRRAVPRLPEVTAAGRMVLAVSAALLVISGVGCSDQDAPAAAGTTPSTAAGGPGFQQALAYARCIRENGVPDYPDPDPGDGRVLMNPGGDDPKMRAAAEACRDKMPQGVAAARGGDVDKSKVTAWARCIRDNGVSSFPDPEVEGNQIKINLGSLGMKPDDPKLQQASSACQDKSPGGALIFEDGE